MKTKQEGFVLLLTLLIMTSLSAIAGALVVSLTADFRQVAIRANDAKAFWIAEAGVEKAIWNLKTPVVSGGLGENWTTLGMTENLAGGNYLMEVTDWDFALSANGTTVAATSSGSGTGPQDAIDNNSLTYWESNAVPSNGNPQDLTLHFPYPMTINKAKFVSPSTGSRARSYLWQVSPDNITYTTVFTGSNVAYNAAGTTNDFTAVSNVNYLRFRVTRDGQGSPNRVRISTIEVMGKKIISTGTINSLSRQLQQTTVVDDSTQTSYDERDWNEI